MNKTDPAFREVCLRFGCKPDVVAAIVTVESTWDPYALRFEPGYVHLWKVKDFARLHRITEETEKVAQMHSYGLMQIMGGTARSVGFTGPIGKLYDPKVNVEYGCRYLGRLMDRYPKLQDHIAAYNAGSARRAPDGSYQNQRYVDKVLRALNVN